MDTYPALGTLFVTPTYGSWYDRIIGWTIRFVTGTKNEYAHWGNAKVNHAGIFVGFIEGKEKPQLMEARPVDGFGYADWDKYGTDAIWLNRIGQMQLDGTLVELKLSADDRKTIVARARSIYGAPYNFLDILAIAFAQQRIRRWDNDYLDDINHYRIVSPWWVERVNKLNRFICSQADDFTYMDVLCLRSGKRGLFADGRLTGMVSPADLLSLNITD